MVARGDRYKAKTFIDTVVYRAGDQLGAWAFAPLAALGAGVAGISSVAVVLAGLSAVNAIWLGRKMQRMAGSVGPSYPATVSVPVDPCARRHRPDLTPARPPDARGGRALATGRTFRRVSNGTSCGRDRTQAAAGGSATLCVMGPVDALYENGTLRPVSPLPLRSGERVALIVVRKSEASRWDADRFAAHAGDDLALAEAGLEEWAAALDREDRG